MRLIVTNYSSAVDLGVMFGRVAICFKVGQEDYGKQCTRGVRRMKCYLPQLPWPGTQEVAWRLIGLRWRWAVLARCFSSCVHPTGQRRQNSLWSGKRWDLSSVGAARLELPGWTLGEPGEPGSGAPSAIVGGPRPFMTTAGVLLHQVLL